MAVDVAALDGFFKDAYGDLTNLIPDSSMLTKDIPFEQREREGRIYRFPVIVQASHGFTYADPTTDGAFAINPAISMRTQSAEVNGAVILLNETIGYDAITRGMSNLQAFANTTSLTVEQMAESHGNRLEIATLYGRSGLANILSSANASATATVLTVTVGSWALGIWSGMENAEFDVYNNVTKINTNAALILTVVGPDARTLRVTGNAADIAALDTAVSANPSVLRVFFQGAFSKEQYGLDQILSNTGNLFSIDASAFALWRANVRTITGQLTMAKVLAGVAQAQARGLKEKLCVYVNPITWSDLNSELSALTRFNNGSGEKKNGAGSITYQGGVEIEVKAHSIVKQGEAFGIPLARCKRVGSTDVTAALNILGGKDSFFFVLPLNAGVGLRSYSDCALIIETPARCVKWTGFTNSAGS